MMGRGLSEHMSVGRAERVCRSSVVAVCWERHPNRLNAGTADAVVEGCVISKGKGWIAKLESQCAAHKEGASDNAFADRDPAMGIISVGDKREANDLYGAV